ncbi:hypothetical protein SCBWM1_gp41 [Synechococcus phage S-CBWM1]|uniref:Uncharacterized protein n=1 Tax=Synechococcus phage S-CBWM1 TaxID=2053653 RepID=A0A3G1L3G7_9CAUD|nr:hypothetical protein HOU61_gp156 [Synechococcus phage S-CBWM1]ATW62725.1 hypothetical protein SCBWM1_gp41 [Synechococcus phage S-CBWM1]
MVSYQIWLFSAAAILTLLAMEPLLPLVHLGEEQANPSLVATPGNASSNGGGDSPNHS